MRRLTILPKGWPDVQYTSPIFIEVIEWITNQPMLIALKQIKSIHTLPASQKQERTAFITMNDGTVYNTITKYDDIKKMLGWYPPVIGAQTLAKGV